MTTFRYISNIKTTWDNIKYIICNLTKKIYLTHLESLNECTINGFRPVTGYVRLCSPSRLWVETGACVRHNSDAPRTYLRGVLSWPPQNHT